MRPWIRGEIGAKLTNVYHFCVFGFLSEQRKLEIKDNPRIYIQ